jgi:hypothetical protein
VKGRGTGEGRGEGGRRRGKGEGGRGKVEEGRERGKGEGGRGKGEGGRGKNTRGILFFGHPGHVMPFLEMPKLCGLSFLRVVCGGHPLWRLGKGERRVREERARE